MQTTSRPAPRHAAVLLAAAAMAACAAHPAPLPSAPVAAAAGALAIYADPDTNSLVTLEIDPATGGLAPRASLAVKDALMADTAAGRVPARVALCADPRGRFVYMSIGAELVSYAVDGATGQLRERGRARVAEGHVAASALQASERQVHGIFEVGRYPTAVKWMAFQVDAAGVLSGRACFEGCLLSLPDRGAYGPSLIVPDATGRFVHTDDAFALVSSVVQPDGSVIDADRASVDLYVERGATAPGLAAVSNGFRLQAVAIDAAGRLQPGPPLHGIAENADLQGMALARNGALAALGIGRVEPPLTIEQAPWRLDTFRISASGEIHGRGTVSLSPAPGRSLAWDPSGRFLYVTTAGRAGIEAYADTDGAPRPIGAYPWGRTSLVTFSR